MNPTNMVLVKSCCSNYQSFIHPVLASSDRREKTACWIHGRRTRAWERAPLLLRASSLGTRACRPHAVQSILQSHTAKGQPSWPPATHWHRQHSQAVCKASSPPPCYAFNLQKMKRKVSKWAADLPSLAEGFLFSPSSITAAWASHMEKELLINTVRSWGVRMYQELWGDDSY